MNIFEKLFNKIVNAKKDFLIKSEKRKIKRLIKVIEGNGSYSESSKNNDKIILESKKIEEDIINNTIETLAKSFKNNKANLFKYIKNSGTKIFNLKYTHKLLSPICEKEGFIPPKRGFEALYLNLITNYKLSFYSDEMFIFDESNEDFCEMLRHFYLWYNFKLNKSGYNQKAMKDLQKIKLNEKYSNSLSISEIQEVRYVINRNIEALDFIMKYAFEQSKIEHV